MATTISAQSSRENSLIRRSRARDEDAESATWPATVTSSPATRHSPRSGKRAVIRRCSRSMVASTLPRQTLIARGRHL